MCLALDLGRARLVAALARLELELEVLHAASGHLESRLVRVAERVEELGRRRGARLRRGGLLARGGERRAESCRLGLGRDGRGGSKEEQAEGGEEKGVAAVGQDDARRRHRPARLQRRAHACQPIRGDQEGVLPQPRGAQDGPKKDF